MTGSGTKDDPWTLKTPPQTSDYLAWHDPAESLLVCQVGSTKLCYQWRGIEDLHAKLKARGEWRPRRRQPGGRILWHQKGLSRALCELCATDDGTIGLGRGRTQPSQQSDARPVTATMDPA